MTTTLKKHFIYQVDFQHWSNDRLFESLDVLDEEARRGNQGMEFESLHKTLNHILVVARSWAARLKGEHKPGAREDVPVPEWKELKHALRQEFRAMQRWLEGQPESFFDEQISDLDAQDLSRQVWVCDALTQVMTHAAHLRGQAVAVAVRLGAPAPELDYIFYKREMERSLEHLRGSH
jgi:uncharacterized damage-inducible protein DinB